MNQIHKNISFSGISQFFYTALAFLLVPVAARCLTKAEFGLYTTATTLGFFFSLVVDLGWNFLLTREIAKKPSIASALFARSMAFRTFTTGIAFIAAAAAGLYYSSKYGPISLEIMLLFTLVAVMGAFAQAAFSVFRGFEQMQYEALSVTVDKLISVGLGITFLLLGFGLRVFALTFVAAGFVKLFLSYRIIYKKFLTFGWKWKPRDFRIITKVSFYFGVSAFLAAAYNQLDIVMLSFMKDFDAVSEYQTAHKLLNLTVIIPTMLQFAFLPQLAQNFRHAENRDKLFSTGLGYLFVIIIPLIPAVVMLAKPIIILVYSEKYMASIPALQILGFAAVAQMMNTFFVSLYTAVNKQNKIVRFQVFGLLLNLVLNLLLIPRFSFIGASITTVATEWTIFIFIFVYAMKNISSNLLPPIKLASKIVLSTAIMVIVILITRYFQIGGIFSILGAAITYGIALHITQVINISQFIHLIDKAKRARITDEE